MRETPAREDSAIEDPKRPGDEESPLPREDQDRVEAHKPLRSPVVYEVIRQEGEVELKRPLPSLWWSGLAAGIGIYTSLVALGALRSYLPDTGWRPLVESLGYCVGFLIVVIGRLQLFTENTITAVLPLLADWSRATLAHTLRLWAVVLLANVVGTAVTALLVVHAGIVPDSLMPGLLAVAADFAHHTPVECFVLGIPAGFLIAALVWMGPNADGSEFAVVVVMTYVIALGGFTHVVVGSAEVATLVFAGESSLLGAVATLVPALLGNVVGGTGLFALLAWAQVRMEM